MIELTTELIIPANIQASDDNIANRWNNGSHLIGENLPPIPINCDHQHSKDTRHGEIA